MLRKFLFVLPTAKIGGAERVTFNLITFLLERGENITLITMSRGKQSTSWEELEGCLNFNWIVGEYKSEKASLIPITAKLISLNARFRYDYIFSTHIHVNSYLSILKKAGFFSSSTLISRESFMVFEKYSNYKGDLFRIAYRFLYGKRDLLICQTDLMKDSLIKNLGFKPAKKTTVIPNPVNLNYILSNIYDVNHDNKLIIACGRLVDIKQFDFLIDSFFCFSENNPEFKLVILGDGPLKHILKSKIEKLGLSNKVSLIGKVKNPYKWFAQAEIGVVSSKREGFPNVLLEMMASGTSKIVTTPCTAGLDNIPGLIVTSNTSKESILDGLNQAVTLHNDQSIKYKEYITKNHTIDKFWSNILKHLDER